MNFSWILLWWAMANPQPVCVQIWEDGFRETVDCKHSARWADHKMPQNAELWPPACGPDNCIAPDGPSANPQPADVFDGRAACQNCRIVFDPSPIFAIFSPGSAHETKPSLPLKDDIICWRGKDNKVRCEDSAGHDATAPLGGAK